MARTSELERRLLDNWEEEIRAATTYSRLAEREPEPNRKRVLAELAATERRHALKWATRLKGMGVDVPAEKTVHLPRSLDLSLRFAPVDAVIASQEAEERKLSGDHAEMSGDDATDVLLAEISREDSEHAATLRALMRGRVAAGSTQRARSALDHILEKERWHRRGGGWIGGAIYGVNDGLAAVFGIVAGTSAATQGGSLVLIAGVAGALASAVSMGAGAYLAEKSESEVYDAQLARERQEISEVPEEERHELELFNQLNGLSESESKLLADRVAEDPQALLRTMAVEELGLTVNPRGNPLQAGLAAVVSTAAGASITGPRVFFMLG